MNFQQDGEVTVLYHYNITNLLNQLRRKALEEDLRMRYDMIYVTYSIL